MFSPGQLVEMGDVALHNDGEQHVAVILSVDGDDCEALFFTSNPDWSDYSRRATRDELAMAGFIHTRATYLAYVKRSASDFKALGRTFPAHWIESLTTEFRPVQKLVQAAAGR